MGAAPLFSYHPSTSKRRCFLRWRIPKRLQRVFKVRRSADWRKVFYGELERSKLTGAEFEPVLRRLYKGTGFVEASFASKLVAAIDPDKPILDSRVLAYFGLRIEGASAEQRLSAAIQAYDFVCKWYDAYLGGFEAAENVKLFDSLFPGYEWISDAKKIDFYLWSSSQS